MANDWRTEIHDSDGLAMWRGNGEWVWRPLTNPLNLQFNAFGDQNPRGFGLVQRDRNFDHYQDDGVFYDRRPCAVGRAEGRLGRGLGAAGRDSDRGRDLRQHRRLLEPRRRSRSRARSC